MVLWCTVKSNDMMLAIYLASLIRSVLALHKLIDNKETRMWKEKEAQAAKVRCTAGSRRESNVLFLSAAMEPGALQDTISAVFAQSRTAARQFRCTAEVQITCTCTVAQGSFPRPVLGLHPRMCAEQCTGAGCAKLDCAVSLAMQDGKKAEAANGKDKEKEKDSKEGQEKDTDKKDKA